MLGWIRIGLLSLVALGCAAVFGGALIKLLEPGPEGLIALWDASFLLAIGIPCGVAAVRFTLTKLTGVRQEPGFGGPLLFYALQCSILAVWEVVMVVGFRFGAVDPSILWADWGVFNLGLVLVPGFASIVWVRRPVARTATIWGLFGFVFMLIPRHLLVSACDTRIPVELLEVSDEEAQMAVTILGWGFYFLLSDRVKAVYGVSNWRARPVGSESVD